MEQTYENKERILCNTCKVATWHFLLFQTSFIRPTDYSDPEETTFYGEKWEVFQCMGCEEVTIRETDEYATDVQFYNFLPDRTVEHHKPKRYQSLPENLQRLYGEVINAINKNSLLLCAAGLRALLEGLCENQGIREGLNEQGKTSRSLEGKINGLTSIIPPGIVRNLHGLRFLGNQALHELEVPSKDDLELALTVIEDIFNVVYDLNYKSQLLYDKITNPKSVTSQQDDIPF
jgi:hypothetical protein